MVLAMSENEKTASLGLIRPPGTTGLPEAHGRRLNTETTLNLTSDADLTDQFIVALGELIQEIKRTGSGQRRYELENGSRGSSSSDGTVFYTFPFTDASDLFEEAKIEIRVDQRHVNGLIVSVGSEKLVLGLEDDIGSKVQRALLFVDSTALLEALKEKIAAVKNGEIKLNRTLADATVCPNIELTQSEHSIRALEDLELNTMQRKAYAHALREPLTFIWGPPGCGKTKTLGEVVRAAFAADKRILVCSNTNKAVDEVLYRICELLTFDHRAMKDGKIVRIGQVSHDKLFSKYQEYVTVDGIAERLSVDLNKKKRRIDAAIQRLNENLASAQTCVDKFDLLAKSKHRLSTLTEQTNEFARRGNETKATLRREVDRGNNLARELWRRRDSLITIFQRSELEIQGDIQRSVSKRERLKTDFEKLKDQHTKANTSRERATEIYDKCRHDVVGEDLVKARARITVADEKLKSLREEVDLVDIQISALRTKVLEDATIIGATCTKAYLSQKDIGYFDLVILDEASMIIRPVVWFSAGLARERVVISGDFRQIPTIVPTEQQALFDVLSPDPFTATNRNRGDAPGLTMLSEQFRMRKEICRLIAEPMYGGNLFTSSERKIPDGLPPPEPFDNPLTLVDTSDLMPFESKNQFGSRFNLLHALLARNLAWYFHDQGVVTSNNDLGICTPYNAESRFIRTLLEGESLAEIVHAGTVHRLQGDERRIVLVDIPESVGGGRIGQFVQGEPPEHEGARLMNVAVSRAQEYLLILANLSHLDEKLPSKSLMRHILFQMQQHGSVVSGRHLLSLRPIESDLEGLLEEIKYRDIESDFGAFNDVDFEKAFSHDVKQSKRWVVIFSPFVTMDRVARIGDLLRVKISAGVKVRCVTRPPRLHGSIPESEVRKAIDSLEKIGVVIDYRANMHEKVSLIDNSIVWWGSLNVLSHSGRSDEVMTRVSNEGCSQLLASQMTKRQMSSEKVREHIADAENPCCPECNAHSVLMNGRYGAYFECEKKCGWRHRVKDTTYQTDTSKPQSLPKKGSACPKCGSQTRLRNSRYGPFYGCSKFPKCKGTIDAKDMRATTTGTE